MGYNYSKGETVQGDIAGADDSNRDTKINFGEDSLSLEAAGAVVFKISGSHAYLGPETAGTVRLCHNGNWDTYFEMYANDSFEFVVGGINYLKMKEGGTDWIEINKNKADLDFKLWGTSTAAPAIKLDAGEESLSFNAGIRVNSNDVTSFPYTVAARDYFLPCAGSGARTINLPAVSGQTGRIIIIKDSNGSAASGNITIDGNGSGESSEKIDGSDTYTMSHNKESITLICDGVGWAIAARVQP